MRLGIYGGSFDPVHYGHLLLAETCREACRLDEVWLVPAARPPHKQDRELTPARQRVEMLELALAGNERLRVSTLEIERGGVSYTVDTLRDVARRQAGAELFVLMGADSLRDLLTWREPQEICRLAAPLVVRRSGAPEPDLNVLAGLVTPERLAEFRALQVQMPLIELSSSALRARALAGKSLRFRTPRPVEQYIQTQGLYRAS
jgi:nicotinate-nucleotide adenylyltransferase